jgi:hypothetical protein
MARLEFTEQSSSEESAISMAGRLFAPCGGDGEARNRELEHCRKWVSVKGRWKLRESEPEEKCEGITLDRVVL